MPSGLTRLGTSTHDGGGIGDVFHPFPCTLPHRTSASSHLSKGLPRGYIRIRYRRHCSKPRAGGRFPATAPPCRYPLQTPRRAAPCFPQDAAAAAHIQNPFAAQIRVSVPHITQRRMRIDVVQGLDIANLSHHLSAIRLGGDFPSSTVYFWPDIFPPSDEPPTPSPKDIYYGTQCRLKAFRAARHKYLTNPYTLRHNGGSLFGRKIKYTQNPPAVGCAMIINKHGHRRRYARQPDRHIRRMVYRLADVYATYTMRGLPCSPAARWFWKSTPHCAPRRELRHRSWTCSDAAGTSSTVS